MEERWPEGTDVRQPMARWREEPGPARWDPSRSHKGACDAHGGELAGEQRDMNKIQAGCSRLSRQRERPQPRRLQKEAPKARKGKEMDAPESSCQHRDVGPARPISYFWPPECICGLF